MATRSAIINVMAKAVEKAARSLVRDFGEVEQLQVSRKGPADFVSAADMRAEKIIRAELEKARPDFGFLMEEAGASTGKDPSHRWIVDPLDGTTNFLHGFPWYAVSVGALVHGELAAAVVLNCATGEAFSAARGLGARRNGQPIRVSSLAEPARALIGTGFPFKHLDHLDAYQRQFAEVTRSTAGIRRAGSAALDLCDVACGRFEAFWEQTLAPWDVAAGILIVREAGGLVTDLAGAPACVAHTALLAGNPPMHAWMLDVVRRTA
jgi:myo-inositol-1(or 4)-monophosphatase